MGQSLSEFGTRIAALALPVIAVQLLRADDQQVGLLTAAETVASLLFGLAAGAWVDRWLKRRTMMIADAVRFLATLSIPVLWLTGRLAIWHLYAVATVVGLATVFFDVSYQSYIPILMPDGEIGGANSRLESTAQLASAGGPAIGGLLMRLISAPIVMLSGTCAYAVSFVSLIVTRDPESGRPRPAARSRRLLSDIGTGLAFVWHEPAIRRLAVAMGASSSIGGAIGAAWASALVFNVSQVSLRQRLCPRDLLGRMNASIRFVVWGTMPLAAVIAGGLATRLGVVTTMWIGGLGSAVTVLPILGIGRFIPAGQPRLRVAAGGAPIEVNQPSEPKTEP